MNHDYWYLSRGAGFTAYLLLTAAVVLGLAVHTRFTERFVRRNASYDLHRFVSILALAFTLFHMFILLGDAYFEYTVADLLLPFRSPYRPVEVAVGVFATYGLVVVIGSFYVRRFIGFRAWRVVHYLTFALFVGSATHSILAGTDTHQPWAQGLYLSSTALVLTLVAYRIQQAFPATPLGAVGRVASTAVMAGLASLVAFGVIAP